MSVIVRPFENLVLELENPCRLPLVAETRPAACPRCATPAGVPGALKLIGHGMYQRQVCGLAEASRGLVIHVRRYLCLGCRRTTSVLPDELHPRRWYAAVAILSALTLSLFRGKPVNDIRRQLGGQSETRRWRTLERWKRQLLSPLWRWRAPELGYSNAKPSSGDDECATRLRRLLALHGASDSSPPDELAVAARAATTNTAHSRTKSWQLRHAP